MDRIMYNVIHPIGRKVLLQVFLKVILKFSMPTIGVTNKQNTAGFWVYKSISDYSSLWLKTFKSVFCISGFPKKGMSGLPYLLIPSIDFYVWYVKLKLISGRIGRYIQISWLPFVHLETSCERAIYLSSLVGRISYQRRVVGFMQPVAQLGFFNG